MMLFPHTLKFLDIVYLEEGNFKAVSVNFRFRDFFFVQSVVKSVGEITRPVAGSSWTHFDNRIICHIFCHIFLHLRRFSELFFRSRGYVLVKKRGRDYYYFYYHQFLMLTWSIKNKNFLVSRPTLFASFVTVDTLGSLTIVFLKFVLNFYVQMYTREFVHICSVWREWYDKSSPISLEEFKAWHQRIFYCFNNSWVSRDVTSFA